MRGRIVAGCRYGWSDIGIRASLIIIAVVDFAAKGAIGVGLPTLAHGRFAAGATGLGILFAAWGVGATAGALAAGFIPPPKRFGWLLVGFCAWVGTGIALVGALPSLLPATVAMGIAGIATAGINTYGFSGRKRRTAPPMRAGRMSRTTTAS